ncbi:gluconate 2-dehydrogenase subunit 3 family protein [Haloechinothrix sp. LS1_15]|uniref:gluconate 2-dehydrogenase subunit 3 family protein n=1 Tax=Haloechinothrix sp. LS1_15 TaxID=2652248 RepID=UPI00294B3AC6|nr:gluconate 2-dehydrogenase subunit 3 family protein [Haloechinothrix sp. LS1_15]
MLGDDGSLTRRVALRGGGVAALAVFLPIGSAGQPIAVAGDPDAGPLFLTEDELRTLRAVVDRIVPADHHARGAEWAGCAEAIDGLLGAFLTDPPRIFAGAPFSDRAGSPVNHFAEFLPLDAYEEMAWRLRIEGSRGRPELERNGPVTGLQTIYRQGLAALDEQVPGRRFAELSGLKRDLVLRTSRNPAVTELMEHAVGHTMEFTYGAPEYGGNRDLVGWDYTGYQGDVQPRGWTREEVERRDADGGPAPPLPDVVPREQLVTALALAHPETVRGALARSDGRLSALRGEIGAVVSAAVTATREVAGAAGGVTGGR